MYVLYHSAKRLTCNLRLGFCLVEIPRAVRCRFLLSSRERRKPHGKGERKPGRNLQWGGSLLNRTRACPDVSYDAKISVLAELPSLIQILMLYGIDWWLLPLL